MTVLGVMLADLCFYVPSVASFRLNWISSKLAAAYTAALDFEVAPEVRKASPGNSHEHRGTRWP